jgi:cysteine desulfurase
MIYLDNHATTPVDPQVVAAMLPWLTEHFGNPHSSHAIGRQAADVIEASLQSIAQSIHAPADSIVITSGATESNNLAIRGVCTHPRQKRRHVVTVTSEHPAVLDVVGELQQEGFRVTWVPVQTTGSTAAGIVDLNALADAIDDDTALVSVMWANNEIGAIAPLRQIAELCHQRGALLHSDATQAVGRIAVDMRAVDVDLISATAHKMYGPKGTGLLVVGNGNRRVRVRPQIIGGGQQRGLRSGTMNPAGIVGLATAMRICDESLLTQQARSTALREKLWDRLSGAIDGLRINGPEFSPDKRLPGNLNLMLPRIEGEAWMMAVPNIACSSGSACSGAEAKPSHVLTALGLTESEARRSVRFGIGRFNNESEIASAAEQLIAAYHRVAQFVA